MFLESYMAGTIHFFIQQPLVLLIILYLLTTALLGIDRSIIPERKKIIIVLITFSSLAILYYLCVCFRYISVPSFIDHIEPSIAMQSMLVNYGKTIYTRLNSPDRFTVCYGPSAFLMNSFFLKNTSNPVMASKAGGVFLALASLLALFASLKRSFSFPRAFFAATFCVLIYLLFYHFSFWNRPDSAIILGCSLVCCGILMKGRYNSLVVVSLGAALAVNAKFHAVLYLLSLMPFHIREKGWRTTTLAVLVSVLLTLLPFFLFPSFSLHYYLEWLKLAGRHALEFGLFLSNIQYAILLLIPLFAAFCLQSQLKGRTGYLKTAEAKSCIILLVCMLFVIVIGSKEGAGSHHLIPFTPVIATLAAILLKDVSLSKFLDDSLKLKGMVCLGVAWIMTIALIAFFVQMSIIRFILTDSGQAVCQDLADIKSKYRNLKMSMGYSDDSGYKYTFFRPLLFDRSHEYFLDAPAIMDMIESGLSIPDETIQKIKLQHYDIFLIPDGGEPFSMKTHYYPYQKRLFGDILPVEFMNNYTKADESRFFSIWLANRLLKK